MEYLERRVQTVEDRLAELIASVGPPALRDQLDHVALAGGKRVRPTVTVLACEVVGGEPADAVDFAVGVELDRVRRPSATSSTTSRSPAASVSDRR